MLTTGRRLARGIAVHSRRWRYGRMLTLMESDVVIEGPLAIRNEGQIILRKAVRLRSTTIAPITIEAIAGGIIEIGERSFINRGTLLAGRELISIGKAVVIADRCIVYDSDWHPMPDDAEQNCIPSAPVLIEDNVWIGAACIILKGVTVGRGTVVAAGSVVTKSMPACCVVAGNPAQIVRPLRSI